MNYNIMEFFFKPTSLLGILLLGVFTSCNDNPFGLVDEFKPRADSTIITVPVKQYSLPFLDFQFFQFTQTENSPSFIKFNATNLTHHTIDSVNCLLKIYKEDKYIFDNLIFTKRFFWPEVPLDVPIEENFTVQLPTDYGALSTHLLEIDLFSIQSDLPFQGLYSGTALLFKDTLATAFPYKEVQVSTSIQADGQVKILLGGNSEIKSVLGLVSSGGSFSGSVFDRNHSLISNVRPDSIQSFLLTSSHILSCLILLDNSNGSESTKKITLDMHKEF